MNFITWLIVIEKMNYILIKTVLIIMCVSQPLKLKSSWHFVKWITLNSVFMTHHIPNVLRFFTALQPFFYIYFSKIRTKWRRFWVQRIEFKWFLLKLKSIIMFLARGLHYLFTFLMVKFTTLFRRGSTLCKSTLTMTTLFRRCLTLLKSTL